MVGGDEQAYKTLNPLFKNLGKNIMYMGYERFDYFI
jgi:3-hydroxyisobutyrate dehydrogenase-like beta-hydroxyacid dehydrogenase